jgi:hypothetical protein
MALHKKGVPMLIDQPLPRLMITCRACGRRRYVRSTAPKGGAAPHCFRCLSVDVVLAEVMPDPKSGKWPAEEG